MWEIAGRVHIFESGFRGPSTGRVGPSGLSQCGISLSTVFRMNVGRPPRVFVVFRPPANVDYERAAFLRVLSFARARARNIRTHSDNPLGNMAAICCSDKRNVAGSKY